MNRDIGILILRVGLGALMLPHGWGKLTRFVDQGLNTSFSDPLGVGPLPSLVLTIFAEVVCSILIIIGFKTRLASIPPAFAMLVAAFVVHLHDPWARQELALLYFTGFVCLIFTGSGKYSLDRK